MPEGSGEGGPSLLTRKLGPAPMYVWGLGIIAVAFVWRQLHPTAKAAPATAAPSTTTGSAAAAGQPGSPIPQFVIENNQPAITPPGAGATPPVTTPVPSPFTPGQGSATINVGHNQTVTGVLNELHTNGFPDLSWADIWDWNPDLIPKYGLTQLPNGDWQFTQYSTPLTINQPNTLFDTKVSGNA